MAKTKKSSRATAASAVVHDQKLSRGEGGELHQTASGKTPVLTTAQGGPVSDDQNSLKIGPLGSTLLEDFHFREKIFHFDHERIPERVVHARGYAAHGFFETYKSLAKYTKADLFQRAGEKGRSVPRKFASGLGESELQPHLRE
jgi:catalase